MSDSGGSSARIPRLRINEIFHSLQGEADTVGYPTVFVRLTGCPLRCQYCDTEYAFHAGDWFDLAAILLKVQSYGARHVCVTGGEPLAQPNCLPLLELLCDAGYQVSLETSGAMDVGAVDPRVARVIDVKTPGSKESARNRIENFQYLTPRDQLKFVICSREDYDWSKAFLAEHGVGEKNQIFFLSKLHPGILPRRWPNGFCKIGCRCAFSCSCTRFCGATCRASERVKRAIVLLSGGLDSATVLAIARSRGFECFALSVRYGQRHSAELDAASQLAMALGAKEHRVMSVDLAEIGGSALTDSSIAVPEKSERGIPVTYVPARNTIFLALALGWAEVAGAEAIFIGVNAVDYSGYPDCRPEFVQAFYRLAQLATKVGVEGGQLQIEAPLIDMSKADIIRAGHALGVHFGSTVSCYQADRQGRACGRCDSCRLRAAGFAVAGMPDPTRYV